MCMDSNFFCFICFEKTKSSKTNFKCEQCAKLVCSSCFDILKKKCNTCPYCRFEFKNNDINFTVDNILSNLNDITEREYPRIFRRNRRNRIYSDPTSDRIPEYVRERRRNRKIRQREREMKRQMKMRELFPISDDLFL